MIRLEEVMLAPGGEPLVEEGSWHIRSGERAGLVGSNGTGKSTLLRAIVGEGSIAGGQLHIRPGIRLGYLPQQAVSGSQATVWDEARSQMHHLQRLRSELELAEAGVTTGTDGAAARLDRALEAFRHAGGFSEEETIGNVLHGLGFAPETWHQSCETFSGGWQMRIALARLLLSEPDVALLDEPTNHLDLLARSWLAEFLARAPFATVVVSHDRHLLDRVAQNIVEIRSRRLHHYAGNFTRFLSERELRVEQQQTAFDRQREEIDRLERFVTRFKAKATKASQARSRQKQLDKMERLEAPERQRLPRFSLPAAPASDLEMITLRDVSLGWVPEQTVITGLDLRIERGMRLAVLGANGCGKSTLLAAMRGTLKPHSGRRRLGERVRMGIFTQDLAAELPPEQTALEHISATAPMTSPEKIRSVLGALGLRGDMSLRLIGQLSGGEKARVALAALTARPHNLLLLDEPTNHLDTETVEVLVRALAAFDGAMVLVTHDRYLVEQLATHVLLIRDGQLDFHKGVEPTDLELRPPERDADAAPAAGAVDYAERKRRRSAHQKLQRELEGVEADITAAEAAIVATDAALCEPGADYEALGTERAATVAGLDALMSSWEDLSVALEEAEDD
jgi:ATP-binding cassette subfamily F protein 3